MSNTEKKRYNLKAGSVARRTTLIDYAAELNPAQYKAVSTTRGPQLVIAGAGSGKTRTLVYRVAYLIEQGIEPERILLLTFTKKAAEQMMRRAASMLDGRCSQITGGTFHGFANTVLRKYAERIGFSSNFRIADRGDAEDIINVVRAELGFAKRDKRFPKKRTILSVISKSCNTGRAIEELVLEEYSQYASDIPAIIAIAEGYRVYKKQHNVMDYDDLLVHLKTLLSTDSEICERLSSKYQYIMIDEFQDTNFIQADIAHLLASTHQNIMVVGDDAQSIYSFRGANFNNIMEFPSRYENCTITPLEHNYRSTEPILGFCNEIMTPAKEKYDKALYSGIASTQKPVFIDAASFDEQALFIAQHVLELREEGVSLNDIAVLFRSGWHSNELEFELSARNIPFVKHGGLKFIEAAHVKDLVSILRVLHNAQDGIAWHRILLLFEGIGTKTAQNLVARILEDGIDTISPRALGKLRYADSLTKLHSLLSDSSTTLSPQEAVKKAVKFYKPLLKANYDDYKKRENDIGSFGNLAERYRSMSSFLDELSLNPPELTQIDTEATDQEKEKLVLSTIHSAKGLEWHSVFVICLIDGFIPSAQALRSDAEVEEERRLLYVACTRAKQNLYLICPQLSRRSGAYPFSHGVTFSKRSRFLSDMTQFDEYCEEWVLGESEDIDELID